MQPVAYGTKRQAGPILNVMLGFMVVTAILGVVCLGLGGKIGDDLSSAKSFGSAFWWGGLVVSRKTCELSNFGVIAIVMNTGQRENWTIRKKAT